MISALVLPTGDPVRCLCDQDLLFHAVFNHKNSEHSGRIEHEPIQTLRSAFSLLDCEGPFSSPTLQAVLTSVAIDQDVKSLPLVLGKHLTHSSKNSSSRAAKRIE